MPEGMPVIWGLTTPKIGERGAIATMLDASSGLFADVQVNLADKSFAGKDFEAIVTEDHKSLLVCPDRKDEKPLFGASRGIRQGVKSVFDALKGRLGLERHGVRTLDGVMVRRANKLLSMAARIWCNWKISTPRKRSLVAYDR